MNDPLGPASGCLFGVLVGAAIWAVVGVITWWVVTR